MIGRLAEFQKVLLVIIQTFLISDFKITETSNKVLGRLYEIGQQLVTLHCIDSKVDNSLVPALHGFEYPKNHSYLPSSPWNTKIPWNIQLFTVLIIYFVPTCKMYSA